MTNNDEIELPEPVAWYRWNDDYRSWSFTLRKPENDAGWEPLHSGGQLRAAILAERERVRAANTSPERVKESAESGHERAQAAEPVGYIEPRHLEFLRTQIAKETRSVFIKSAKDELRTIPLYRAAPAEVTDAMVARAALEAAPGGGDADQA